MGGAEGHEVAWETHIPSRGKKGKDHKIVIELAPEPIW